LKRPEVAREVEQAKRQPLSTLTVNGVPDELAASLSQAAEDSSVHAFQVGLGIAIGLVALGGVLGLVGIVNPRRRVEAADCPGGQFVGQPRDATRQSPCDWGDQALPVVKVPQHEPADTPA
jgi:hypothetical protein